MATSLAEKMFTNGNSSLLKQHTVQQTFFAFELNAASYFVIQLYAQRNLFINNDLQMNSVHPTRARPFTIHVQGVPLPTKPGSSLIILLQTHTDIILLQTHSFSFLTQRTYSCSNLVAISSLVLELLKNCRVWQVVGHPIYKQNIEYQNIKGNKY